MNINRYVRIVKIHSQDDYCEFFQGAVILKHIAHKKMPKTINWPKLLFLDNMEENTSLTPMNTLISEESDMTKLFVKKIESIDPNIVICSHTLSERIITKLMKKGIVVVINVNYKDFNHLARITSGCILKSVNQACMLDKILGKCRKMECQVINDESFIYFSEIKDYTLGGCIIIQGSELNKVTKIMKQLLIDQRNAKLERIFLLECGAK